MLFLLESSQWTEVTGDPPQLISKIMVQHSTLNLMQYQPGWIRCIRCGWCNSGAVLTQGDAMQCMQWWCHYLDWVTTLPYQSPLLLFTRRVSSRTKRKGRWWLCQARSGWVDLSFLSGGCFFQSSERSSSSSKSASPVPSGTAATLRMIDGWPAWNCRNLYRCPAVGCHGFEGRCFPVSL